AASSRRSGLALALRCMRCSGTTSMKTQPRSTSSVSRTATACGSCATRPCRSRRKVGPDGSSGARAPSTGPRGGNGRTSRTWRTHRAIYRTPIYCDVRLVTPLRVDFLRHSPLGPAAMPREVRNDEEDEESEGLWKGLVRDLLVAGIIVVIVLVGIYVYTGVWPPLVVVESQSMQHSGTESHFGVIDTGDMVFQQAAPNRADVVTYLEGRASGYA